VWALEVVGFAIMLFLTNHSYCWQIHGARVANLRRRALLATHRDSTAK
jgi:hypothetical protein